MISHFFRLVFEKSIQNLFDWLRLAIPISFFSKRKYKKKLISLATNVHVLGVPGKLFTSEKIKKTFENVAPFSFPLQENEKKTF